MATASPFRLSHQISSTSAQMSASFSPFDESIFDRVTCCNNELVSKEKEHLSSSIFLSNVTNTTCHFQHHLHQQQHLFQPQQKQKQSLASFTATSTTSQEIGMIAAVTLEQKALQDALLNLYKHVNNYSLNVYSTFYLDNCKVGPFLFRFTEPVDIEPWAIAGGVFRFLDLHEANAVLCSDDWKVLQEDFASEKNAPYTKELSVIILSFQLLTTNI